MSDLVAPAAGHIPDGVASPPQQQQRHVEGAHELDALPVAPHRQVEAPQPIPSQGVGSALQHNSAWLKHLHYLLQEETRKTCERRAAYAGHKTISDSRKADAKTSDKKH